MEIQLFAISRVRIEALVRAPVYDARASPSVSFSFRPKWLYNDVDAKTSEMDLFMAACANGPCDPLRIWMATKKVLKSLCCASAASDQCIIM